MQFSEREFRKEVIKITTSKIKWKINYPCKNNRNIPFCTLGPLVWMQVGLQYQPLFWAKDHCVPKLRRICQLQLKLLHGNHSIYRGTTIVPYIQYWCIDGIYRIYVARLRNGGKTNFSFMIKWKNNSYKSKCGYRRIRLQICRSPALNIIIHR